MDWQNFALFMCAWTIGSFPLGVLVGRFMAVAKEMDKALWRDIEMRQAAQAALMAPPLALMAPAGVPIRIRVARTA